MSKTAIAFVNKAKAQELGISIDDIASVYILWNNKGLGIAFGQGEGVETSENFLKYANDPDYVQREVYSGN